MGLHALLFVPRMQDLLCAPGGRLSGVRTAVCLEGTDGGRSGTEGVKVTRSTLRSTPLRRSVCLDSNGTGWPVCEGAAPPSRAERLRPVACGRGDAVLVCRACERGGAGGRAQIDARVHAAAAASHEAAGAHGSCSLSLRVVRCIPLRTSAPCMHCDPSRSTLAR